MALEDEIINIEDLDIANEIKIGDYVLLETTDGTKLIDFKDFIIGTDNITFYDKISGGDFLQRADISDLSANVDSNTSILTDISAVYDDIKSLRGQVDAASKDIAAFRADIDGLSDVELSTSTSGSVGVNASGAGSGTGIIYFTKLDFSGTGLATSGIANGTVNIGSASESFTYIANGSYSMFLNANFNYAIHGLLANPSIMMLKNNEIIAARELLYGGVRSLLVPRQSHINTGQESIIQTIRVVAGDKITFSHSYGGNSLIKSGDISITVA